MSREKKKGTSGNAKAFITRAKALKKLQLSLQEFRRLCILKGIFPRDPRKKLEGRDKTYYLRKDIDFLAHERLISTIRKQNAHQKKEVKARAKRRIDVLKRLALSKPEARLDHLVVERYPHFADAIRELDDPLCIVALFANLPADHKVGIAPARVANCQRLLKEFHNFVAETNSLKRVFVSIKGYYFQATVAGESVTWVTPHRFSQVLPADVDYSVMLTFLELYECILSFVNFRLYTSKNLAYPPKISRVADAKGLELAAVETEEVESKTDVKRGGGDAGNPAGGAPTIRVSDAIVLKAEQMVMKASQEDEEDDESDGEGEQDQKDGAGAELTYPEENVPIQQSPGVFAGKSFVLGREVPYVELEFVLKAAGALRVIREDDLPEGDDCLSSFTHWVIDRPKVAGIRHMALEYVQPQYVFDSINAVTILPSSLYGPGSNLPPHLSPFVSDEDDGGYRPWYKDILERIKAGDTSVVAEAAAVVYAEGAANANKLRDTAGTEVAAASRDKCGAGDAVLTNNTSNVGVLDSGKDREDEARSDTVDSANSEEEDEEGEEEKVMQGKEANLANEGREMATLMLSRKKMKLYNRQKQEERTKAKVKNRLEDKRKQLEAARDEVNERKPSKKRRKAA